MHRKILYIGNKLAKAGYTPTTIDRLGPRLEGLGYRVRYASGQKSIFLRMLHMCWAVMRHTDKDTSVLIDTYSTRNFWYAVWTARIARWKGVDYLPILHGGNLPQRLESAPNTAGKLFHGARVNVSPSPYLLEAFRDKGYTKLVHIPNFIDLSEYPFTTERPVYPKLLWVRSFAKIYNPMLAIRVVEQLLDHHPKVSLLMIGPDKDGSLAHCKRYAQENGLPVSFTGRLSREEWTETSKDCSLLLNTTNFDNMPVSVIEAMALGLPIVSTNVGGMPYLVRDGVDGILLPPNDEKAMARAIQDLLADPERARKMAENARKKVERFDWREVAEQWRELLGE